jgi:2-amino-4-hydroxy-6-hydroxymethyldihydropteridine diphosphokinase
MGCPSPEGVAVSGVIAFIGIGANMGRPAETCRTAVGKLAEIPGVRLLRSSSLYRTEPVGPREQKWFLNAVAEIRTSLAPAMLLKALKEIERRLGRTEGGVKWGPRVIDLDILLYGQEVVREGELVIPHPELHRRRFVLVPLCQLASYAIHPAFGVSVRGLLDRLVDPARVDLYDPAGSGEQWGSGFYAGMDKVEI